MGGLFVLYETGSYYVALPLLDKAAFVGDFVLLLVCPDCQLLGLQVCVNTKGNHATERSLTVTLVLQPLELFLVSIVSKGFRYV